MAWRDSCAGCWTGITSGRWVHKYKCKCKCKYKYKYSRCASTLATWDVAAHKLLKWGVSSTQVDRSRLFVTPRIIYEDMSPCYPADDPHLPDSSMSAIGINGFGRIGRLVLRAAMAKGAKVETGQTLTNAELGILGRCRQRPLHFSGVHGLHVQGNILYLPPPSLLPVRLYPRPVQGRGEG